MVIDMDIAAAHAAALANNFRRGNPDYTDTMIGHYVGSFMVEFLQGASNAHGIADDYGPWYDWTILHYGKYAN